MNTNERRYMAAVFCLVLLPNLIVSFNFAGLLHDDSAQMWSSSMYAHKDWFGVVQYLNSFREDFLFHIALYASPQLARVFIVCVYLCGSALILFKVLRDYYDASLGLAMLASVMPFLILSIWHIPIGINISYVAGDVLFTLISIWLICFFLKQNKLTAIDPFILFCVYILMAETQPSSVVTAPIVLVVSATWGPTSLVRRFLAFVLATVAMISVALGELGASRKGVISVDDFFENLRNLWTLSFEVIQPALPFPFWDFTLLVFFVTGLFCLIKQGMFSLTKRNSSEGTVRRLVKGGAQWSSFCVVISGLLWSLVPYALTYKNLNPLVTHRYYFIWQFFFWISIAVGVSAVLCWLRSILLRIRNADSSVDEGGNLPAVLIMLFLMLASWGKATNFDLRMESQSAFIRTLKLNLREAVHLDHRPKDQALLLISDSGSSGVPHLTNHLANSGYLNYLVQPQHFNFGIFADPSKCSSHFDSHPPAIWGVYTVDGFSLDRPLAVYQRDPSDGKVRVMAYLIDVEDGVNNEIVFTLYNVNEVLPEMVGRYSSRDELRDYLQRSKIPVYNVAYSEVITAGDC